MSDKDSILEQRSHPRFPVKLPIQYRLLDNPKDVEKYKGKMALAQDLSLEGMYIKILKDRSIEVGDIFRFDITLPEISKHLFAFGEVAWISDLGVGVHLMLMPEEDKTLLKTYLEEGFHSEIRKPPAKRGKR